MKTTSFRFRCCFLSQRRSRRKLSLVPLMLGKKTLTREVEYDSRYAYVVMSSSGKGPPLIGSGLEAPLEGVILSAFS